MVLTTNEKKEMRIKRKKDTRIYETYLMIMSKRIKLMFFFVYSIFYTCLYSLVYHDNNIHIIFVSQRIHKRLYLTFLISYLCWNINITRFEITHVLHRILLKWNHIYFWLRSNTNYKLSIRIFNLI